MEEEKIEIVQPKTDYTRVYNDLLSLFLVIGAPLLYWALIIAQVRDYIPAPLGKSGPGFFLGTAIVPLIVFNARKIMILMRRYRRKGETLVGSKEFEEAQKKQK
eukprot:TRINITY_DN4843_c0_g1_i2.p1 TRINITY_DN4843_c0_g1~~TRINITY_DN4843_c0_g1_i2.p1  ORF type:complete len:104 (-),score=32.01 TRINITY_DN4843_c0_g1_i2:204-515(-)